MGLPITSYITPADVRDSVGARKLPGSLVVFVPRLKKIWADPAYRGKEWRSGASGRSVAGN